MFDQIYESKDFSLIPQFKAEILRIPIKKGFVKRKKEAISQLEFIRGLQLISYQKYSEAIEKFRISLEFVPKSALFLNLLEFAQHKKLPKDSILRFPAVEIPQIIGNYSLKELLDLVAMGERLKIDGFFTFCGNEFKIKKDYKLDFTKTVTDLDVTTFYLMLNIQRQQQIRVGGMKLLFEDVALNDLQKQFYSFANNEEISKDNCNLLRAFLSELRGLVYPKYRSIYGHIGLFYHSFDLFEPALYFLKRYYEMGDQTLKQFSKAVTRPVMFINVMNEIDEILDCKTLETRLKLALADCESKIDTKPIEEITPQKAKFISRLSKLRKDKSPQTNTLTIPGAFPPTPLPKSFISDHCNNIETKGEYPKPRPSVAPTKAVLDESFEEDLSEEFPERPTKTFLNRVLNIDNGLVKPVDSPMTKLAKSKFDSFDWSGVKISLGGVSGSVIIYLIQTRRERMLHQILNN